MNERIIGILPAGGMSSRMGGIPKFCLPIEEKKSMIKWHVEKMNEVCNEVRICVKPEWVPLIQDMNLDAKIISNKPTNMVDSIKYSCSPNEKNILIGMPDTYMLNQSSNFYLNMISVPGDVVMACWKFKENLRGKVGQVFIKNNTILDCIDKDPSCNYEYMWGALFLRKGYDLINTDYLNFTDNAKYWILNDINIGCSKEDGEYLDIGSFEQVKDLYRRMS